MISYTINVTAQLSTKSYPTQFEPMRFKASSPAVAANKALRAARKTLARKKVLYWNVRIVPAII